MTKEEKAMYDKVYNMKNRERKNLLARRRYARDKEKIKAKQEIYVRENRKQENDRINKWRRKTGFARKQYIKHRSTILEYHCKYRKHNKDRVRDGYYRRMYKITLKEYEKMVEEQQNRCRICKRPETTGYRLAVDHCHRTNRVRGLLCTKCNAMLGAVDDNPGILLSAISYLQEGGQI